MRRSHSQTASAAAKRPHKPLRALAVLGVLFVLAAGDAAARPPSNYDPNGTGQPSTIVRVVAPSNGFDWSDAAIGAAGGFALSMIGIGGVIVVSRRRTPPAAPVG
jgi:hypothetical protein